MTKTSPERRPHPVTLAQAAQHSPVLARLSQLARESAEQLETVRSLIPLALRPAIRPGPIDGPEWCLLVDNNAAAAKLRQVIPALVSRLHDRGWQITSIRLKVQIGEK